MQETEHSYFSSIISFLEKLGYQSIDSNELILKSILADQIEKINGFDYKGKQYQFSAENIHWAVASLENVVEDGLIRTNNKILELLLFGKSYEAQVDNTKKSFSLRYIDWRNVQNNTFHLSSQVRTVSAEQTSVADIVLYINGIPIVIFEVKSNNVNIQSVLLNLSGEQVLGTAKSGPGRYAQLLIAAHPEEVLYAVIGRAAYGWSMWREDNRNDRAFFEIMKRENRLPGVVDQALYSLCRPDRLMELISGFILSGKDMKYIARYHHYFAVKRALSELENPSSAILTPGIIWQPTGTGITMTMLFTAKNILDKMKGDTRILILTDRSEREMSIFRTFSEYGMPVSRADSGRQLSDLLADNGIPIITTVIQKLYARASAGAVHYTSGRWIIFTVEEGKWHRGALYQEACDSFPSAKFLSFIGTIPIRQKKGEDIFEEENIIYSYSMSQAVEDKLLLPVLFEQRLASLHDFTKEFHKSYNYIREVANDIVEHFKNNVKGTGFKALLVASDQQAALMFQAYFDARRGEINAVTIIKRDPMMESFDEGREQAEMFITVDKLLTGWDAPFLSVVYLTRYLRGVKLSQAISRVSRPMEGKQRGLIVDFVGVFEELKILLEGDRLQSPGYSMKNSAPAISLVEEEIHNLSNYLAGLEQLFYLADDKNDPVSLLKALDSADKRALFLQRLLSFEYSVRLARNAEKEIPLYEKKLALYQRIGSFIRQAAAIAAKAGRSRGVHENIYLIIDETRDKYELKLSTEAIGECSTQIYEFIQSRIVRDWQTNMFVRKEIMNGIEDTLISFFREDGKALNYAVIDETIETLMATVERM